MAHHSEKSHWAAYVAMTETNGDTRAAKRKNEGWVPEEPISKWSKFAQGAHTQLAPPVKSISEISHGSKPGPVPHIADSLAYKIATVYTQCLVWQHGRSRHYRSMAEVRQHRNLSAAARPRPAPSAPCSSRPAR
jgi:hypothetical protein